MNSNEFDLKKYIAVTICASNGQQPIPIVQRFDSGPLLVFENTFWFLIKSTDVGTALNTDSYNHSSSSGHTALRIIAEEKARKKKKKVKKKSKKKKEKEAKKKKEKQKKEGEQAESSSEGSGDSSASDSD
eukprot:g38287.t1